MAELAARALILFPGALGDFICLLPTIAALCQRFDERLAVAAKPSLLKLLPSHIEGLSIDSREIADLFASATPKDTTRALFSRFTDVHSWTGYGNDAFAQRLCSIAAGRVSVHRFRGMNHGEHATRYFARCADVAPHAFAIAPPDSARAWATSILTTPTPASLVIHPGSGSPGKNWLGFSALAERWRTRGRVISIHGPAESSAAADGEIVRERDLLDVAALLQQAPLYVGNDSGISHLAAAVGARGMVLFGPSDPLVWRPLDLHLLRGTRACQICDASHFCTHRLCVADVDDLLMTIADASHFNLFHRAQRRSRT